MRNNTVSIAKAIGIILMVVGHSGCPTGLYHFIYFFHMPLFFMISGYFFNPQSTESKKIFMTRKIQTLWFPFVKWAFIFLLLHNLLYLVHFETDLYTWKDIWQRAILIFFMFGEDPLIGGYWFLNNLFYCSVLCLLFTWVAKFLLPNLRIISILFLSIGVSLFGLSLFLNNQFDNNVIKQLPGMCFSGVMFGIGYVVSQFKVKFTKNLWLWFSSLVVLIIGVMLQPLSRPFTLATPLDTPYIIIMALVGVYFVFYLAHVLNKTYLKKLLVYVGDNSLIILTFHFLVFKFASWFIVLVSDLPMSEIASHPHIKFGESNWWWLFYTILGVSLPLILKLLKDKTQTYIGQVIK